MQKVGERFLLHSVMENKESKEMYLAEGVTFF